MIEVDMPICAKMLFKFVQFGYSATLPCVWLLIWQFNAEDDFFFFEILEQSKLFVTLNWSLSEWVCNLFLYCDFFY